MPDAFSLKHDAHMDPNLLRVVGQMRFEIGKSSKTHLSQLNLDVSDTDVSG